MACPKTGRNCGQQTPFGAVVVDRHELLIGEGHNTVRADLDPTAHAEIGTIRRAWRRLGTWQMLGQVYSSCEPCLLCSFVITQIGFSRVVFAARGTDVPTYRPLLGADPREGGGHGVVWIDAAQPNPAHIVLHQNSSSLPLELRHNILTAFRA